MESKKRQRQEDEQEFGGGEEHEAWLIRRSIRALGVRVAGLASLLHAEDAGLVNRGRQGEAQEAGLTPIKSV